jgi:hypothetical protein
MLDEHLISEFGLILQAYGHECVSQLPVELRGLGDEHLIAAAKTNGCDFVVTLDNNRQPEVWSRTMLRLAQGEGRLLRIKTRSTELPTVPNLTKHWALAYPNFEGHLRDRRIVLIQLGLGMKDNRPAKLGFEAYRINDVRQMVQQEMQLHEGSLRVRGTPALNPVLTASGRKPSKRNH